MDARYMVVVHMLEAQGYKVINAKKWEALERLYEIDKLEAMEK